MNTPEMDPFKRHGGRFLERKVKVAELWSEGNIPAALQVSGKKYAGVIFFLFQQKPDIKTTEVADVLGTSWTTAKTHIERLKELGIPLEVSPELS